MYESCIERWTTYISLFFYITWYNDHLNNWVDHYTDLNVWDKKFLYYNIGQRNLWLTNSVKRLMHLQYFTILLKIMHLEYFKILIKINDYFCVNINIWWNKYRESHKINAIWTCVWSVRWLRLSKFSSVSHFSAFLLLDNISNHKKWVISY